MGSRKSQAGLEFVLLISFVMLIFIMIFSVLSENISDANFDKQKGELSNLADKIKNQVTMAGGVRTGYVHVFELPTRLSGANYSIEINPLKYPDSNNSEVILSFHEFYQSKNYSQVLFFYNKSVNVSQGCNVIYKNRTGIFVFPLDTDECNIDAVD